MPNYKIVVEYDGTDFFGWQLQRAGRTVQGQLERALKILNGGKAVRVHGAGRTDTGVHAKGQVASFKLEKRWDVEKLQNALNGNVDDDLFVHRCTMVPDDFHARYSAIRRLYRYYCITKRTVVDRKHVWQVPLHISVYQLRQCAQHIRGDVDLTTFCKAVPDGKNRRCLVYQSEWNKRRDFVIFTIESNRFLQHTIRYLVGTMMEVAKGNLTVGEFRVLLEARDRQAAVFKAPPYGLFLEEVTYP